MTEKYILGLDIGGTNVRAGLVNEAYQLKHFCMQNSRELLCDEPVKNIASFIQDYCEKWLNGEMPEAISLGFPSTISKDRRTLLSTPNIPHLNNVSIVDELESMLGTRVLVNRDVNLLLLFDIHYFTIQPDATTIAIYIGTGLGNAVMIKGDLLTGKNGVASELGHIPLLHNSLTCGCGNIGCLETLASGRYLETLRQRSFQNTLIQDLFTEHWPHPALKEYLYYLSIPIVTEINIFDPDHIILGGGILQMNDFPYDDLIDIMMEQVRKPFPYSDLSIFRAHQDQENGVVGAGIYAHNLLHAEARSTTGTLSLSLETAELIDENKQSLKCAGLSVTRTKLLKPKETI